MNGDLELFALDTDPLSFSEYDGFSSFIPPNDWRQVVEDFWIDARSFQFRAQVISALSELWIWSWQDFREMSTEELIVHLQNQASIWKANIEYWLQNFQS
jgi:hypothetical protein